jgi:hypothetical protein
MTRATIRLGDIQNAALAGTIGQAGPLPAGFVGQLQNHITARNNTGAACMVTNVDKDVAGSSAVIKIDYNGNMDANDLKRIVKQP